MLHINSLCSRLQGQAVSDAVPSDTVSRRRSVDNESEGVGDLSQLPQSGHTDYGNGTTEDPTSAQRQLGKNKQQRSGDAAACPEALRA